MNHLCWTGPFAESTELAQIYQFPFYLHNFWSKLRVRVFSSWFKTDFHAIYRLKAIQGFFFNFPVLVQCCSSDLTGHSPVPSGSHRVLCYCSRLLINRQGQFPCWHTTLAHPHTPLYLLPLSSALSPLHHASVPSRGQGGGGTYPALLLQITRCDEVYRRWGGVS